MSEDARTEWLEAIHAENAVIDQLLDGAKIIAIGGVDGLTQAFNTEGGPEQVLDALMTMAGLIHDLRIGRNELVEERLTLLDKLDNIETK